MATLNHQIKDRELKLYSSKADIHLEYMKDHTASPYIDPVSRKIADLITRRELEVLGIKPTESHSKKFFKIPPKVEKPLVLQTPPEPEFQNKPVKPDFKITVSSSTPLNAIFPVFNPTDLKVLDDQAKLLEYKRKKTQESLVNLETLKAFKDELHRDYPELGLNNSAEGSSFHTNELNELEEACKEFCSEKSEIKGKEQCEGFSNLTEIASRVKTEPQEYEKKTEEIQEKAFKDEVKEFENFRLGSEENDIKSPTFLRSKMELSPGQSKFLSVHSELPTKDFYNLQNSFAKASFLHCLQEPVKTSVPRVHVDLLTCKTTPIYFNMQVGKDAKVKMENGIGPVDSLRFLILNETQSPEKIEPSDTYSKNMSWLTKKNERAKRMRESLDMREMEKCTFHPFGKKKTKKRKRVSNFFESKFISFTPKASVDLRDTSFSSIKSTPRNLVTYVGLSPALSKIGYREGCDIGKMIEKALPLVDYKKINSLT